MSIDRAILMARNKRIDRKWDTTHWLIDWHGTICEGSYDPHVLSMQFYPKAVEALQALTARSDFRFILWTSSYSNAIHPFMRRLQEDHGIHVDFVNQNPEVQNTDTGKFNLKPYCDIIIDDKAGFDPLTEWSIVLDWCNNIDRWYG